MGRQSLIYLSELFTSILIPNQILLKDKNKGNEMGRACRTHGRVQIHMQSFGWKA
jgi:hypothetical protein